VVDRSQIGFIKFILEAHDNLVVMSTLDSKQGVVQLSIAPGCEQLVSDIMKDLSENFTVRPIDGAVQSDPTVRKVSNGGGQSASPVSDA
jgi:hypothetical protein